MKRLVAFLILQGPLRALQFLPLRALHALGTAFGTLMAGIPSRKNAIIRTNLSSVFPELDTTDLEVLRKQSVQSIGCFALESGLVWHGSRQRIERSIVSVVGWDHIEKAQQRGQGLLLVGAHLGNWELLNLYFMMRLKIVGLYKAPSDPEIDKWIRKTRERFGGQLIPSGSQGMRGLLKTLKSGGAAGLIADQQPKLGEGVVAPFFGQPALTMTLVQRLIERTGAEILMASCYRLPYKGFEIQIIPINGLIRNADAKLAATALNQSIEQAIRVHPEQYLWRYRRFSDDIYH